MSTAYEKSSPGQYAYSLPKGDPAFDTYLPDPKLVRKKSISIPELSEIDITRHFASLPNMGIDTNFYPLGSCTMKLNPRVNEVAASLPSFTRTHPLAPQDTVQGNLFIIHDLIQKLCAVTGMKAGSLNSNAGAQGEYVGILMMKAYHKSRGESHRTEMIVPDNAHGTNPASAKMAGYQIVSVRTESTGDIDLVDLAAKISPKTAGLMLTNPNTLGLFSSKILEVSKMIHQAGGLLYYDGANLNAIMNIVKPGAMGFDVIHLNLHKTFSTPHGGGGPGSGPVFCNDKLKEFLPVPRVLEKQGEYSVAWEDPKSIGMVSTFFGNFAIYLRAYLYILLHGHAGLRRIAEMAVLNANYLKKRLEKTYPVPFPQYCMHEFVMQAETVKALDIAKRLLDYGIHAPTIYFPLIIKECMLIEPTESESKRTLDHFVEVMEQIAREIKENPDLVRNAPYTTPVGRLDEVKAVKDLKLVAS